MVWGAFCGKLKSELFFVPNGAKVDSQKYVQHILDPLLIPFWHRTCEEYGWTAVMEDGAPGHKKFAITCRERNEVETLKWPAQSPDLNPIESLWGDMECELAHIYGRITNLALMEEALKTAWMNITVERLDGLIRSMPERLQAVINVNGYATPF